MSNFSLPSPPSPNLYSDFEMAMYLEAQGAGFSSSPPLASLPSGSMTQNRNDSGASILQPLGDIQENTSQQEGDKDKDTETGRQQGPSTSSPAPRALSSSEEVPSQCGTDQEQTQASSSHQATPPARPSTLPVRRSPSRTFTAPTVSWSSYLALSPFSFEGNDDEESQDSSSSGDEVFQRRFPTLLPPTQPSSPAPAVATAQHIHLRSISGGSSAVSEIQLARDITHLPPLIRSPPHPLSLRSLHPSFSFPSPWPPRRDRTRTFSLPRIRSVVSFSEQRFDKRNPSPWYHDVVALNTPNPAVPLSSTPQGSEGLQGSPNNLSSTSLGSRAHTPSGSRFMEHVHANGEAMYMSRWMGVVGSRSDVALGRYADAEEWRPWEGVARELELSREEEEEEEKRKGGKKGEGKRGWKRVLCFA